MHWSRIAHCRISCRAAAALLLGADGVVLGTRFLAAEEIVLPHEEYRKRIIDTSDGPRNTVRAKVFDELRGPNIWPAPYDGRALVSASYNDWKAGVSAEQIIARMKIEIDQVGRKPGLCFPPKPTRKTMHWGADCCPSALNKSHRGLPIVPRRSSILARAENHFES